MIGKSAAMSDIRDTIERVAPTDARILIVGENGSGKELVAVPSTPRAAGRGTLSSR